MLASLSAKVVVIAELYRDFFTTAQLHFVEIDQNTYLAAALSLIALRT